MRVDPAAATLSRIASDAGVSRQALYLHFENRAGLLLAMVQWVDERAHFAERLAPFSACSSAAVRLEGYVRTWLNYLPELHPVPGVLARAKEDEEARAAWADRMGALESLYLVPLSQLHRLGKLHRGLSARAGVQVVRSVASVHAWESLVHDHGWSQLRAVDALWAAVAGALFAQRQR